jgi:hypothetical protein
VCLRVRGIMALNNGHVDAREALLHPEQMHLQSTSRPRS